MKTCFLDKKSQEIYREENFPFEEADRIVAMNPNSISNDMGEVFAFIVANTDKIIEFVQTPYLNSVNINYYIAEIEGSTENELFPIVTDILLDAYYLSNSGISRIKSYAAKMAYAKGIKMGVQPGSHFKTKKSQRVKPIIIEKSKHFNGTMNNAQLAKELGISTNTIKKYIDEIKETMKSR